MKGSSFAIGNASEPDGFWHSLRCSIHFTQLPSTCYMTDTVLHAIHIVMTKAQLLPPKSHHIWGKNKQQEQNKILCHCEKTKDLYKVILE